MQIVHIDIKRFELTVDVEVAGVEACRGSPAAFIVQVDNLHVT